MVDPAATENQDKVLLGRGRVLGGGVALKSRSLGLVLKPRYQSVRNSARIETAVNKRFHSFRKGIKVGAARAKTDQFIELAVHPRYRENIARYIQVVRAVALRESATERMQRLSALEQRLTDPVTSATAALELEAMGTDGIEALRKGISSSDPEVRFYSAEALAYLDQRDAAAPLAEAARTQPAFRVFALTALSAMDDYLAYDELRQLLSVPSAETRYGAFRALWAMNPADEFLAKEQLGDQFSYYVLETEGPPMIHVTRSRRPEIVLFGRSQRLLTPLAISAGNQVMVTSHEKNEITVSKFSVGEADQKRVVSNDVDQVIRAIVELGGTYPDVVQALQEAKATGALISRFEVDALPMAGRTYDRLAHRHDQPAPSTDHPMPELYTSEDASKSTPRQEDASDPAEDASEPEDSEEEAHPSGGFLTRIIGRDSH
jgi:hypothetical protein